jgi:hypothetical protein
MVRVLYRERVVLEKPHSHGPFDPENSGRVILALGEDLHEEEESTP